MRSTSSLFAVRSSEAAPITANRIAQWPTRAPQLMPNRPSRFPRYSPKVFHDQGTPVRSVSRGTSSTW